MLKSNRGDFLRWTLLGILGAPVIACGGEAETSGTGGADGSGGGINATGGNGQGTGGSQGSGGETTTGGASTGGTSSTGGSSSTFACENPTELGGGFERCEAGQVHREARGTCPSEVPRAEPVGDPLTCSVEMGCCVSDADCTGPHQYCGSSGFGLEPGPSCQTGCTVDADCGADMICLCGDLAMGQCVSAACAVDDDCSGDMACTSWMTNNGCGNRIEFTCQTPGDECGGPGDCQEGEECVPVEGTRRCQQALPDCVAGRPFLVADEIRSAGVTARSDWLSVDGRGSDQVSDHEENDSDLPSDLRLRLATYWQKAAQMEHASIAAFARFSLQLLSLGAPVFLIEETNQALVDETRHARQCFALSSRYRGEAVGPSALNIDHALSELSAEAILVTTVLEGCVGETIAALEAAEAAELCTNDEVREVLRGISIDEGRHAELAWKTVRWLLTEQPELASIAEHTFATALRELDSTNLRSANSNRANLSRVQSTTPADARLSALGMLSEEQRGEIRLASLSRVVAPCAEQLLLEVSLYGRTRQSGRRTATQSSSNV